MFFKPPIKRNLFVALAAACAIAISGEASAVDPFILPTPENNPNATYGQYPDPSGVLRDAILMNGIPIAFKYDNFWSYSGQLLDEIQTVSPQLIPQATFGAYDFTTGTGTIDINVTSVAGGATNIVTVNGTTLTFQDPVDLASSQSVSGWVCGWGGDPQFCTFYALNPPPNAPAPYSDPASDVNGVTTTGDLLTYLQSIDPTWTVPLFYADYNQTGAGDSLFFSAFVEVINPATGLPVDTWYLDAVNNSLQNATAPTYNFGDISFGDAAFCAAEGVWNPLTGVGCAGITADGSIYDNLSHNLGSGHADFMVFAPDMDLSQYPANYILKVTGYLGCIPGTTAPLDGESLGCNTNGGEEFGILGGVGPTQVPEPMTLALLGLGIGLLGWRFRRRMS